MKIEGWRICGLTALLSLFLFVILMMLHGLNEEALRAYIRDSARLSLALFLAAFSASSAHILFRQNWSAWLLRNRRYLGLSFAISHGGHLLALILLAVYFPHPFLDRLTLFGFIGGSLAYVFIAAMALTSFAAPRHWLGQRWWKILHTSGSYYLWLVFLQSYLTRTLHDLLYLPLVLALLGVLALRLQSRRLAKHL